MQSFTAFLGVLALLAGAGSVAAQTPDKYPDKPISHIQAVPAVAAMLDQEEKLVVPLIKKLGIKAE